MADQITDADVEGFVVKARTFAETLTPGERRAFSALAAAAALATSGEAEGEVEVEVEGYRLDRFKDVGGNPATQRPGRLGAGGEFGLGGGPGPSAFDNWADDLENLADAAHNAATGVWNGIRGIGA